MRRILHLSDLHFGRIDAAILDPLTQFVCQQSCDLVVISGDLTQRATKRQFAQAQEYLCSLPVKQVVVPGNHDIPLYEFGIRMLAPFRNFKGRISNDLEPIYVDDEVAVIGMNTVSKWSSQGSFTSKRLLRLAQRIEDLSPGLVKVLVTHHRVPRERFEALGLNFDLLLAGHEHRAHFTLEGQGTARSQIVVQAGTTTSTRRRHGQSNSFNLIEVRGASLNIQPFFWEPDSRQFCAAQGGKFVRTASGWLPQS